MKNSYLKDTYKVAQKHFETILLNNSFEQRHLKSILEAMTYEEFADMHIRWLKSGQVMAYITGNFIKQQAVELFDHARKVLGLSAVPKDSLSTIHCARLPSESIQIDFAVEDKANPNSALLSYFQHGIEGNDSRTKLLNELCW